MENNFRPTGLKGREINERMKELMNIQPINENKSTSKIELTKLGPDGNAYAIVRENHQYFIKKTDKTSNITNEDLKYIGGLQNKTNEAYTSYANAIKQLKLKFNSLSEAYNKGANINVFENDNLDMIEEPIEEEVMPLSEYFKEDDLTETDQSIQDMMDIPVQENKSSIKNALLSLDAVKKKA